MQLNVFEIHARENLPANQMMLEANKDQFSRQCRLVFDLLMNGVKLTTYNAPGYGIGDLRRRLKDLKDNNGVKLSWVPDDNGRNKCWQMSEEDKQFNKRFK